MWVKNSTARVRTIGAVDPKQLTLNPNYSRNPYPIENRRQVHRPITAIRPSATA
jgi:hypothetical protein